MNKIPFLRSFHAGRQSQPNLLEQQVPPQPMFSLMSQNPQHPYIPLDEEHPCIRLLTVRQNESSIIECNLEVYSVSNCPAFIALSYVWGHPEVGSPILLNGKEFHVRTSLHAALQAILNQRSKAIDDIPSLGTFVDQPKTWKFFWIDALCIDQENIPERNHQVGLMKQIYSNATFVLAWLGEATEKEECILAEIRTNDVETWIKKNKIKRRKQISNTAPNTVYDTVSALLRSLFKKPYWTRMWIVQEIVLAQSILLMCGNHTLKWDPVCTFLTKLSGHTIMETPGYSIWTMRQSMPHTWSRKKTPLGFLLMFAAGKECSEPRDKVYGLLGLLNPPYDAELKADYSLTQEQVFEQVTVYMARWYTTGRNGPGDPSRQGLKEYLMRGLQVSNDFSNTCFDKYVPD